MAWSTELKAICPLIDSLELDPEGLRQAIHYRFVVGDTMLRGINQVLPASYMRLAPGKDPVETRYWRIDFEPADAGEGLDAWADRAEAGLDAFMERLQQRHSSVAVLLSGGVDSSLLALKAKRAGIPNCVALTARWPGDNPELDSAIAIAKHIGIEHQVVDIDESKFDRLLPWIVWRIEELPRHFNSLVLAGLFEHASRTFETILHGHCADLMFGPADTIAIANFIRRRRILGVIPRPLRRLLAAQLPYNNNRRIRRLRQYLELDEHGYLKSQFAIEYGRARAPVKDLHFRPRGASRRALEQFYEAGDSIVERMQRLEAYTFIQSHFTVLDRLSAPYGIPVAMPFLSREMMAVATKLPSQLKAIGTVTKPVLKRLMARHFPQEWVYRAKQGFPTHTTRWLDGPLERWRQMLLEERTRARGLLSLRSKRKADAGPHYEAVWGSICLELFCRQFLDGDGGPESPVA
jgi:asparagine synthase (glutamine-hydrolysing)